MADTRLMLRGGQPLLRPWQWRVGMSNRHVKRFRRRVFQVHRVGMLERIVHSAPRAGAEPRRPCIGKLEEARYATDAKHAATIGSMNYGTRNGPEDTFEAFVRRKRTASNQCCMRTNARLETGDRRCEQANRTLFVGAKAQCRQSVQLRLFPLRRGRKTGRSGMWRIPHQEQGIHEDLASDADPYAMAKAVLKELQVRERFFRFHSLSPPAGQFCMRCHALVIEFRADRASVRGKGVDGAPTQTLERGPTVQPSSAGMAK